MLLPYERRWTVRVKMAEFDDMAPEEVLLLRECGMEFPSRTPSDDEVLVGEVESGQHAQ